MAIKSNNKIIKVGDKVKLLNSKYAHCLAIKGEQYVVTYSAVNNTGNINIDVPGYGAISVLRSDVSSSPITKEEIEIKVRESKEYVMEWESKLKWMRTNKVEEFDEDEYKVWKVLETIDESTSNIDKAKKIAALINK